MLEDKYGHKLNPIGTGYHWKEIFEPCMNDEPLWTGLLPCFVREMNKSIDNSVIESEIFCTAVCDELTDLLQQLQRRLPKLTQQGLPGLLGMVLWFLLGVDERAVWVPEGDQDQPKRYLFKKWLK